MAIFNFGPWETKELPVLDSSLPTDVSISATNSATFKVSILKDGMPKEYTYQWYEDGEAIPEANADTYTRNTTKNDGGKHMIYCTVTNKAGTITSRTATLTVDDSAFRVPAFSYDGSCSLTDDSGNPIQQGALLDNWKITLKTGGTLRFSELGNALKGIEAFLVGGGGNGGNRGTSNGGGGGGHTNTQSCAVAANTPYPITIGGSGGATSAFGYTANPGGNGSKTNEVGTRAPGGAGTGYGGSGGGYASSAVSADGGAGGSGVYAFGDSKYGIYGGGGGGGGSNNNIRNGNGGAGGAGGGGAGGDYGVNGNDGTPNTGGGGGGGGLNYYGGSGGSGIVIIRNKR